MLWLFFIIRIAYNIAFAKVVQDVRSDDEESEEEKVGKGGQVGTFGHGSKEKTGNGRVANGNALEPNNNEAVVERKKER